MKPRLRWSILALLLSLAGQGADEPIQFRAVALTGMSCPDVPGAKFPEMEYIRGQLLPDGRIWVWAPLPTATGVLPHDRGNWIGVPGQLKLACRSGQPLPGGAAGEVFGFCRLGLVIGGDPVFHSMTVQTRQTTPGEAWVRYAGQQLIPLLNFPVWLPHLGPGFHLGSVEEDWSEGIVGGDLNEVILDAPLLLGDGQRKPDGFGNGFVDPGSRIGDEIIWRHRPATGETVALLKEGDPAPLPDSTMSAQFAAFQQTYVLGPGDLLLAATLAGEGPFSADDASGWWRWKDGVIQPVIVRGSQAPGLPAGVRFHMFHLSSRPV